MHRRAGIWKVAPNSFARRIVAREATASDIKLLGTSFQKALRAFWGDARPVFGVHWCIYTNGHRNPGGLRDARKGIGVQ